MIAAGVDKVENDADKRAFADALDDLVKDDNERVKKVTIKHQDYVEILDIIHHMRAMFVLA